MWIYILLSFIIILLIAQMTMAFIAPDQSTRRKMMIASWSSPTEGNIYGLMEIDATSALAYVKELREKTGKHISITHVALKAIGLGIQAAPSLNGRIVLGRFVPHKSVDIGCLVAIDGGKNLANAKITDCDKRSVSNICDILSEKASKLRGGKDQDFEKLNQLLKFMPVFILRRIVYVVGIMAGTFGMNIPALGVRPFPFGSCLVTSVGMMGLDVAFVPFTPFARVPLLVMVGGVSKKPMVIGDQVVARDVLTITATLDHRFLDGSQGMVLAKKVREVLENPQQFDVETLTSDDTKKKEE